MTIKQMVSEKLTAMGADGLCREDCSCKLEDLMPCGHNICDDCEAAKRVPATIGYKEDWGAEHEWMLVPINTPTGANEGR